MSTFQAILQALILAATAAQAFPDPAVDGGAALAAKLLQIVQAAVSAHESVTGKALDPSQLHMISQVA